MRLRLIALLAAIVVTPALAQMQPMPRPVTVQVVPPASTTIRQDPDAAKKVMTIEDAQAQIAKLRAEKRDLDARLTEALATIDGWTRKGGTLVHAYCASGTLSQRSDGAGQEDCAHNGYMCSEVDGMCRHSCNDSAQCSTGFTCHMPGNYCEYTAGGVRPS